MVWALFLLRPYLQGTRFVVRTDHKALRWMLHMDGAHGRLVRWRLRLAEFDYTVETKPGRYGRLQKNDGIARRGHSSSQHGTTEFLGISGSVSS